MSVTSGYPQLLEINASEYVYDVKFTADGKHLVSGTHSSIQVWRVKDGKLVVNIPVQNRAFCVAASRDGRFIAAGTENDKVFVWDTKTYEQVIADENGFDNRDVDFSPDGTRFVCARNNHTVVIWDVASRQIVRTLKHNSVLAIKYSTQGDRIASAGCESVRVWDSKDGHLLAEAKAGVETHESLLWRDNYLFVMTKDRKIVQIDASTGSTISEWPVPDANYYSRITRPQHGRFIAFSAERTIAFLDPSASTQPHPIQHTSYVWSIACSSDGQLLAFTTASKITVKHIFPAGSPLVMEPGLEIDAAALDTWEHDQLTDADAILSTGITMSQNSYHALANRAVVRTRMGHWDAALADARESIEIQRSLLAYVAKSAALIGKGEKDKGIRVCDMAFEHFHSEHVSLLLLIKAVILFMAGDHVDAMSRVDDLITDSALPSVDSALYGVQAYMCLLLGNKCVDGGEYERATRLFEDAQIKLRNHPGQPPLVIRLLTGWRFDDLAIIVQQRLCEALLAADRTMEASECVMRMLDEDINVAKPIEVWVSDFKRRCCSKLEDLGDSAMKAKQYNDATSRYTAVLSLNPTIPQDLLVKRSRAYAENGKWEDSLNDATEAIQLDPSSPSGYERKHAALLGLSRYSDAINTFETMLLKMSESSDPKIFEQASHYVRPEQTRKAIYTSIKNTIHNSPLVLINTLSGRLYNKTERVAAFESLPAFMTLVASMTTHIDFALIEQVVGEFYCYATFSHTQEDDEPLYETIMKTTVYDLDASPTHNKLQMFCKITRDEGFNWAWSDICCIDQEDQFVLQESIVNRFKWYEGSAMTIVFLCDVDQLAEVGALVTSLWNSRVWALLEYHASKVVRFYTEDWMPYLGLTIYNHKESPEIVSEMEKATGIPAESLAALRPGLTDIREKLHLASTRQTACVEDAAYSLLGFFSMTLPITYGEGDKALGRLLSRLLTNSGDTSILAWNGRSGSFNSCLPTDIVVFGHPATSHIPPTIPDTEMETITAGLDTLSLDLDLLTRLYHRVDELPPPTFSGQRMRLSCFAFKVTDIKSYQDGSGVVFHAQAGGLGAVEIKTSQNIMVVDSLYLVHPWIDFLLGRHAGGSTAEITPETLELEELPSFDSFPGPSSMLIEDPLDDTESISPPTVPLMDAQMEFLTRLRQPFGALLLAPVRRNVAVFRRIAAENVITAQVEDITLATLNTLIESVRMLNVL